MLVNAPLAPNFNIALGDRDPPQSGEGTACPERSRMGASRAGDSESFRES